MREDYRICVKCVMDTSDNNIYFDEMGVCNHCNHFRKIANKLVLPPNIAKQCLDLIVSKIKRSGQNNEYDCIIGLSGGLDSSYLALLVKNLGLRPLAVHFDNGWNSEISIRNIENIVKLFGYDLQTYVINWEEFKDLQRSFFMASVVDIELLTDNAIFTSLYKIARNNGIKYCLDGNNVMTEAIMGDEWSHWKYDQKNIRSIQKQFGSVKIKNFPMMGPYKRLFYQFSGIIHTVCLLNMVPYRKEIAIESLERELGWKNYGGKHQESVFTKFYQGYVLPKKFKIDKRRAHYSNLICSGQMTREAALDELEENIYPEKDLNREKEYVIKKLGFTEEEFEKIMNMPIRKHTDYPSSWPMYSKLANIWKFFRKY